MRVRDQQPEWVTSTTAAEILGCSPNYLMKLRRDGVLTSRRVGSAWTWFVRKELEELAARSITPARHEEPVACA